MGTGNHKALEKKHLKRNAMPLLRAQKFKGKKPDWLWPWLPAFARLPADRVSFQMEASCLGQQS